MGTVLNLTCIVEADRSLVDTDIRANFTFNISPGTRIIITMSPLNQSTYKGTIAFSVLLPSDRNTYTCVSSFIPVSNTLYVMAVTNPASSYTLRLEGEYQ